MRDFWELQATFAESERSWLVNVACTERSRSADIDRETFDLSVKNPNTPEDDPLRDPYEIMEEIKALDEESADILAGIGGML